MISTSSQCSEIGLLIIILIDNPCGITINETLVGGNGERVCFGGDREGQGVLGERRRRRGFGDLWVS